MTSLDPIVERFCNAPYGHRVHRDKGGLSHVTLYALDGRELVTIVAPTFDEAATSALDIADEMHRPTTPTRNISPEAASHD